MSAITKPGVYDIPVADYHADPVKGGSLSSSGARKLLPPSCPAKFKYEVDHPPPPTTYALDFGSAAHRLVLGDGPEVLVVDADDWRSKNARSAREAARAEGVAPVLRAEYEKAQAMAEAIRRHPVASALFRPGTGKAEQALMWQDAETGVWRRSLLDWLPDENGQRLIVPDYKTARSASPETFTKSVADYGYYMQAAFYLDGIRALGLDDDPAFVLVAQEKDPPYIVTVFELDVVALRIGAHRNREALDLYAKCKADDHWPDYSAEVELISLPVWVERQYEELIA
jgi:hypothetical protein